MNIQTKAALVLVRSARVLLEQADELVGGPQLNDAIASTNAVEGELEQQQED